MTIVCHAFQLAATILFYALVFSNMLTANQIKHGDVLSVIKITPHLILVIRNSHSLTIFLSFPCHYPCINKMCPRFCAKTGDSLATTPVPVDIIWQSLPDEREERKMLSAPGRPHGHGSRLARHIRRPAQVP